MPPLYAFATLVWLQLVLEPARWSGQHAVAIGIMVLAAYCSYRAVHAGLRVRRDGIEVTSSLRPRRRFTWREIDHFEIASHAFLRSTQAAWLVARNGERLCVTAMTADDRGTRRRARLQQMVDELNARVAREHAQAHEEPVASTVASAVER